MKAHTKRKARRTSRAARRAIRATVQKTAGQEFLSPALERVSRGFGAVLNRMGRMLTSADGIRPGELATLERQVDRLWDRLRRERARLGLATPQE